MFNLSKKDFKKIDFLLLLSLIVLVLFGLTVLRSALNPLNDTIFSQVIATIAGILAIILIFLIDLDFIKRIKWLIYIISVGLLIATIIFGYGGERWGANLWIKIGPINLQPSEISKVLHILFLSSFIGDNRKKVNTKSFIIKYLIFGYLPVILIIIQADIGTALVVAFITTVMFFMSGISWKNIAILSSIAIVLGLISLPFVWNNLAGYAQERITDFQEDDRDLSTSTHQTDRGLIALGSGLLSGRGYMKGPFSQNRYIPEQHTDFIFPVLVEDFGFLGGAFLILMYMLMFYRMIVIAGKADELYHTTLVMGAFALLFIHIFENIGMTMKVMPVTGIPLPFLSNGGTFQLMNLILLGFVLSISMHKKSLDF